MLDWDKISRQTYGGLRAWLAMEDRKFEAGGEDIKALAARIVSFWQDEAEGNLTARLLDAARPTAEMLCVTYGVESRSKPRLVAERIKCFALSGSIIISSLEED